MLSNHNIASCAILLGFSLFSWLFWHYTFLAIKRVARDVWRVLPKPSRVNRAAKALARLSASERQALIAIIKE